MNLESVYRVKDSQSPSKANTDGLKESIEQLYRPITTEF